MGLFDAIHTIDRDKIAQAVAAETRKQGRALRLLVQVNTGEEPQKAGGRAGGGRCVRGAVSRGAWA